MWRKYKKKHKVKAVSNYKKTLGYMEYPEPGYSWHYYVIRDYLTGMSEDNTNHIIQPITANRDERVKGGGNNIDTTGPIKPIGSKLIPMLLPNGL